MVRYYDAFARSCELTTTFLSTLLRKRMPSFAIVAGSFQHLASCLPHPGEASYRHHRTSTSHTLGWAVECISVVPDMARSNMSYKVNLVGDVSAMHLPPCSG